MIPRVLCAAFLVTLAYVQAAILPLVGVLGIMPNLLLVTLLLWSMAREPREGLLWALAAGLFLDLLSQSRLGVNALALLPVVAIGWASRSRYFRSGLLFPLVMTVAATLAHDTTRAAVLAATGAAVAPVGVARLGILGALLNLLVVPPLYGVVHVLDSWIGRSEAHARA
ncbi:MAG TPA: rod shape-determining protein MreD [Thermomicrobiales bacterium]|nr:rod shape-determining protein MreD [Thermomicrobiales bacterium]